MYGLTSPRPKSLIPLSMVIGSLMLASVPVALAQDDGAPAPTASAEPVLRWPGTTASPGGLYSFQVGSDAARFMHRVPDDWSADAPNAVELVFLSGQAIEDSEWWANPVARAWRWRSELVGRPFADRPAPVANLAIQVWLLDVGDTRVAIQMTSYPDTDPALLAEAVAVVESITVRPAGAGTLVFRLPDGWDSG